jgi:hypothetical protein
MMSCEKGVGCGRAGGTSVAESGCAPSSRQTLRAPRRAPLGSQAIADGAPRQPARRLDELGLVGAVRARASSLAGDLHFDVVGPAAYRIAVEAMTNALRHSQARHCLVSIGVDSREVRVDVRDDGSTSTTTPSARQVDHPSLAVSSRQVPRVRGRLGRHCSAGRSTYAVQDGVPGGAGWPSHR